MKSKNLKTTFILLALVLFFTSTVSAQAAPHLTLSPTNGNYGIGNTFSVVVGVDSGVEKVVAMDVVGTFDKNKLELVTIEKVTTPDPAFQFTYEPANAKIDNVSGTFQLTLPPLSSSVYDGIMAKQGLLTFYFRPKASGSATLNFTCTQGTNGADSNIVNNTSVDVVTCAENQSGLYTIDAGVGGAVATPTTTEVLPVQTATELPQTGGIASTVGLIAFGVISVASALFLMFL